MTTKTARVQSQGRRSQSEVKRDIAIMITVSDGGGHSLLSTANGE